MSTSQASPAAVVPPTRAPSDEEVFEALLGGDTEALGEIARRHQARLVGVARRVTKCEATAEDAVQEAFVRVLRFRHSWDGRLVFPWLRRIVVNCAIRASQRRHREPPLPEAIALDVVDPALGPASWTLDRESAAVIARCLNEIPEPFRSPIVLRIVRGFAYDEIASSLGIPVGTVKSRLNRARSDLQVLLAQERARAA